MQTEESEAHLYMKYYKTFKTSRINRSNHHRCSIKKGVLKNFAKFTGEQLCESLFFNKFAGPGPQRKRKKRDSGTGVFL